MKHRIFALCLIFALLLTGCGRKTLSLPGADSTDATVAIVGQHRLSGTEFAYYYVDAVNEVATQIENYTITYKEYGLSEADARTMASATFGFNENLDLSQPLSQLIYDSTTGKTMADYFAQEALSKAQRNYMLYDAAVAAGFELPKEDQEALDAIPKNLSDYTGWLGYSSVDCLIQESFGYGKGASVESYMKYMTILAIADAYYESYVAGLTYSDADCRAYESYTPEDYNSYSYAYCGVEIFDFLGTKEYYSDKEWETAKTQAEKTALELISDVDSLDSFNDKIDYIFSMEHVEDEELTTSQDAIHTTDVLHTSAKIEFREWLAKPSTVSGSATVLPMKDESGLIGYYAVYLEKKSENKTPEVAVRHLMVQAEDISQKADAYTQARGYLDHWLNGEATEESFAQLVSEYTDDTASAETGGLYENIHQTSSFVEPFLNWSIDPVRKVGDTEIIESEYGYHVMYFVGHSSTSYRDQLISEKLREEDAQVWLDSLYENCNCAFTNLDSFDVDMVDLLY